MEFRRRRVKGKDKSVYCEWWSEDKQYRITWTNQYGYALYHALVRSERPGGGEWWHFAQGGPPKKAVTKFKHAVAACEKHKKFWDAFVKLSHSDGRRDGRLAALRFRAPAIFSFVPVWVRETAAQTLIEMLCPKRYPNDRGDRTEA